MKGASVDNEECQNHYSSTEQRRTLQPHEVGILSHEKLRF
jgi:hypothetical protein